MIDVKQLTKKYDNGVLALDNLDLHIEQGEFVFVIGPSGSGKSTFIRTLIGEIKPTNGSININGENITRLNSSKLPYYRRNIGIVFQDYKLLPNLTVYENVAFALEVIQSPKSKIKRRVMDILDLVGLKDKYKMYPNQLSGGQQQRIAIARAFVSKPFLLICDEPTGNLDPKKSKEIMEILFRINSIGTTIIMATHDQNVVNNNKKRVIAIVGGKVGMDKVGGKYNYHDKKSTK